MPRTLSIDRAFHHPLIRFDQGMGSPPFDGDELRRRIAWIIAVRTVILFLGLNLASPLGILPARLGPVPFLPFFNVFSVILAFGYLALWWNGRRPRLQLYVQIAVDFCIVTLLVALTNGSESAFVSFYLLIIAYCSLTLRRNGGVIAAALSTILYAGVIATTHPAIPTPDASRELSALTFRVSFHALGFFTVAFLGSTLSLRLQALQKELDRKVGSLERLRHLNEHIVSSIRSGLVTTDLDGRITLFNNTAEELTGRPRHDVMGCPISSVTGKPLWEKTVGDDIIRDSRPLRHEEWMALPGGVQRFLGYSVSPLLDQNRAQIGYIVAFQDLTEIKRLEDEVRLKERMAAVGRMAAGIAHEIRNPLTAMRGSVEILRSHLNPTETDARLMNILVRESDRLNKFVEDFLSYARPSKYPREPVDLVPLLHDTVLLFRNSPEVQEKLNVGLKTGAAPVTVLGNADRLSQVFWNLAQNALRAMPRGGALNIEARRSSEGGAEIVYEDEGIGMTAEQQAQLFQPFSAGFSRGTGLGLSIVFQIIEDHKGKIHFESEKGRGTRVTIWLPTCAHIGFPEEDQTEHAIHTSR